MSEERPKSFLSRVFGAPEDDDHTSVYRDEVDDDEMDDYDEFEDTEEAPIEQTDRSFTVERAAEIIKHLPPEVPRSSAVRIVRQTLTAAGINIEVLARSTQSRETKLEAEIDRREGRIKDLRERTEEVVRNLERQIRESRETRDTGISDEERRISSARDGLDDVERVRDFFSLPRGDSEPAATGETTGDAQDEATGDAVGDETQVIDRDEADDDTRVIRRSGSQPDDWNTGGNQER